MTKIAIISDIHGNTTALKAVLRDIKMRNIERIYCLGDLIGKGPRSSECIKLVQMNCEKVIRGNWDVIIQSETDSEFIQWFKNRISADDYQYVASLPFYIDLKLNGQLIRFLHASPRSEFERIIPDYDSLDKCLSMFDNSEKIKASDQDQRPDIVFYGDLHTAFLKTYKNGVLCNVGSVGSSLDLTTASYAVLDGTYSTNTIQFVRVPYDQKAEINTAKEMGLPLIDKYYNEIMFAQYRNA
ncbi:metallophosphoesterase family protein [Oceanobacillus rekensis]|uniref:metallophosphoesterase family protein n=1 Tax=Oceanobacillus rekensis TaxID=937927 RepID=UPI000B432E65|nr:metallophosphoesterase family protein [Oceanobacillus rekensis]